ncbi:hypothetical protein O9H85_08290 [Paenibacillus filicis]|uniref:Uncharacterized protein n=1 Tax=Paenibacillus gyeongsangnamensis TaxID=3388067 RepID=A0ABT4Q6D3_9BACL|nr:hypothetical protein [Paenibacillus filicis]MCZ8512432.1 hypothetical protein [Paenibacillus filicis]
MTKQFEIMIQAGSRSKESFVQFIAEIEIAKAFPWVIGWLDKFWTDSMSKVFFTQFWNGSIDEDILDDIEACMIA